MKNPFFKFCLLVCILLFSVACSRSEKLKGNEFLIEGTLSDIEDGVVIILGRVKDNNRSYGGSRIATDTVRNGHFSFKGEAVSNPDWLYLLSGNDVFVSMQQNIWVAPGVKVKIKGKGKIPSLWEVKSSVPYQKEENRYTNESRDIIAESVRVDIERSDMMKKIMAAPSGDESFPYRKIADSLTVIRYSLMIKQFFAELAVMEQTNISVIWLDRMQKIAGALSNVSDIASEEQAYQLRKKVIELYGKMSEEDKKMPRGQLIAVSLFPPDIVEVGNDMADADLLDINGNTKHLSDYLGKYMLLDFWSIGCGPCIAALPEMKEISETYRDKLTIISISLDSDAIWKEALKTHDMPWINIRDPKSTGGLGANYGVRTIPNYIMISPEGKVVDKWAGYGTGSLKRKVEENIK